jgi:hypothetical protein
MKDANQPMHQTAYAALQPLVMVSLATQSATEWAGYSLWIAVRQIYDS